MAYAIRGVLDGSGVPDFLKQGHDFRERYLPNLLASLSEDLSQAPKEAFIPGLEDILVSEELLRGVRQLAPTARMKGKLPVSAPTFTATSEVVQRYVQRVKQELPPQYIEEAKKAILGGVPHYAANLQEAAKAFGVNLPQGTV